MKRRSVLHVLNNFSDGSITRIVYNIIANIGSEHFDWHVGVVKKHDGIQNEFNALNVKTVDFSDGDPTLWHSDRINGYLQKHGIDIVHTHTPRTLLTMSRVICHRKDVYHLSTKHILNSVGDRKYGLMYTILDRFSLYLPDHLIAVSKNVCDKIKLNPGIDDHKVSVINNGIDPEYFHQPQQREECRSEFKIEPGSVLIGTSGRLEKVKRLDLLLKGFAAVRAKYPCARLVIIGEGKEKNELAFLAAKLGISDAVTWTGFRSDIPRLLAAIDIYVQSSVNEGLSLSILEAMAAGKTVIATDVGGAAEIIVSGESGIIIPPGSSPSISEAIVRILEDPLKGIMLARSARSRVCKNFSVSNMTEGYRAAYNNIKPFDRF